MRYRESAPNDQVASIDQTMVFGTAAYALVAGVLLCVLGFRHHVYWLISTGILLIASSSVYLLWRAFA